MINLEAEKKFAQESTLRLVDGEIIFHEGDNSSEMYVVVEGEVTVSKQSSRDDIHLATLHRGEFVGEMSLLESLPRSATAKAKGNTKLLVIHPGGFLLKIRRDPTFAFEMLQSLSKRIRLTNESLMRELDRSGHNSESLKNILNGAEYNHANPTASPALEGSKA